MCKAIHQMFSWVLYGMAYSSVDRHIVAAGINNVRILGYLNVVLVGDLHRCIGLRIERVKTTSM